MIKIRKLFTNPLIYPFVLIILHLFTYGIFFYITDKKTPFVWLDERRMDSLNLIWFYDTYWPNWLGIFIVLAPFFKLRKWKYSFLYLGVLFWENFFIATSVMDNNDGLLLIGLRYEVIHTNLFIERAGDKIAGHFCLWLAMIELILKIILSGLNRVWKDHSFSSSCLRQSAFRGER